MPIDSSMDSRMRALHALLQDHTYVQLPKKNATATAAPTPVTVPVVRPIGVQFGDAKTAASCISNTGSTANQQHQPPQPVHHQQKSQQIATFMQDASGPVSTQPQQPPSHAIRSNVTQTITGQPNPYGIKQPPTEASFIPGFPFAYNAMSKGKFAVKHNSLVFRNLIEVLNYYFRQMMMRIR